MIAAWCAALTMLALAPLLVAGYVLTFDMVFTPRQFLVPAAFGVGSAPPRAVPVDAVMALLTSVVPGQLIQKAVLVALLFFAGVGAARLVPQAALPVRLVAATLYSWNAYVAERLVIGHWTLLVAYAGLPWLVRSAMAARDGHRVNVARAVSICAVCALSATGGLLAAAVVVAVVCLPGTTWRIRAAAAAAVLVVNAPWWMPGLLQPSSTSADASGVRAFAVRSDTLLGDVGSVLGMGGIWNAQVVPDSRGSVFTAVAIVVILVVAAVGAATMWRRERQLMTVLLTLGVLGFGFSLVGSFSIGRRALETITTGVPGAGLLRDGQKFVALLAPLQAVCFATGAWALARLLQRRLGSKAGYVAVVAGALLLPLVALPDLAWGAGQRLQPVAYPSDWEQVRHHLREHAERGDVLVLPWATYRRFDWNDGRTSLDPAPRFFPSSAVSSADLVVGGESVPGEDPRAAAAGRLLESGRPLVETMRAQGIAWVVVERQTPGPAVRPGLLTGAELVLAGPSIELFLLPGEVTATTERHELPVLVVDVLVLSLVLGCVAASFRRPRPPRLLS